MFLQAHEVSTHEIVCPTRDLSVKVVFDETFWPRPWQARVYKETTICKIFDGYCSPEGARTAANSFIRDAASIFDTEWLKQKQV